MGNYISCNLIATPSMKNSKSARVIFPTGEIRQFREPIKAAELMLESPNFFLVNSVSLTIGRRFSPLSADEDLEFGNVYIMFAMRRLNSVVTAGDMAALFLAANSAAKRISGGGGGQVRVTPENSSGSEASVSVVVEEEEEMTVAGGGLRLSLEENNGFSGTEFRYRFGSCRSRRPQLETIKEEQHVC